MGTPPRSSRELPRRRQLPLLWPLEVAVQAVEEATTAHSSNGGKGDEGEQLDASGVQIQNDHPLPLEPEVLERLCGAPVELRGYLVLTAPRRQIALRDPGRRAMTEGGKLVEAAFGGVEGLIGLLETALLEERAAEHELCVADLVD